MLQAIEQGQEVDLKPHEQALLDAFAKNSQQVWKPWWFRRDSICDKIEEVHKQLQDINLNEFDTDCDEKEIIDQSDSKSESEYEEI